MKRTEPSRSLFDQAKPLKYVRHEHTDIRKTLEKFRRLHAMQRFVPDEYQPPAPRDVDAAGTYLG